MCDCRSIYHACDLCDQKDRNAVCTAEFITAARELISPVENDVRMRSLLTEAIKSDGTFPAGSMSSWVKNLTKQYNIKI